MVKFIKLVDDEPVLIQKDNEDVIYSCFQFCVPHIRKRVKNWLERPLCRCLTLHFKEHVIRLEK